MTSSRDLAASSRHFRTLLVVQMVILCSMISGGIVYSSLLDLDNAIYLASLMVAFVAAWSFCSWHLLGRELFSPYGLFLLSASMFNGGQAILEILGLNVKGILGNQFRPELTVKALYAVALGLASFHLGALLAVPRARPVIPTGIGPSESAREKATRTVGWFCLAISAIPSMMVIRDMIAIVGSQGYIGLYGRPISELLPSSVVILAGALVPGVMFVAGGSGKHRISLALVAGIVVLDAGLLMLAGLRHAGAPFLISFAWLYHVRIRRFSRAALLSAGVGLLALFAVVASLRDNPGALLGSIATGDAAGNGIENPIVAAVREMGMTLGTVAYTVDLVPANRPYDYGVGYAYALFRVVPNVGWSVHPAAAHGAYSEWLTNTVAPATSARGGGLGYSFIAEPFANFGWYGVPALLAMTGFLLVRLSDRVLLANDPAKYAAVASFLIPLLFFPRDESLVLFRPLLYYSLLPYAAVAILSRRSQVRRRVSSKESKTIYATPGR